MFSIMLLTIAIMALAQFAIYYWRAVLSGVASAPVAHGVFEAAEVAECNLQGRDFAKLVSLHNLTPELHTSGSGIGPVRLYYALMSQVDALVGKLSPAFSVWVERERVLCARYAAVQIDRRLQSNLAQAAAMNS